MAHKEVKDIKYIQSFIVEDHHEVVPYIHTYIGSKQLPFKGISLVHFDSHPDLLIPIDMLADTVFNKHSLYDILSIENWIMPLVYAGHISTVYWLKAPWCEQIEEKTLEFYVGKCVKTGKIRTTCQENYFISEALFVPEDQLENKKKISLIVICVKPKHWSSVDKKPRNELYMDQTTENDKHTQICKEDSAVSFNSNSENVSQVNMEDRNSNYFTDDDASPHEKKARQESLSDIRNNSELSPSAKRQFVNMSEKLQGKQYILDVDLDFYSTKNPFQELYTPEQLCLLGNLYKYTKPSDTSQEAAVRCAERRAKQLETLKKAILDLSKDKNADVSSLDEVSVNLVKELIKNLCCKNKDVDFELIHEAGCTMDDTELPHHISSQTEIIQLMDVTTEILKILPPPRLITCARSSNDDYCPQNQVDFIQENLIQILQQTYPSIVIMPSYDPQDAEDNAKDNAT